jgi:xanthine dehydrogenase iron-sulfur cluster and FAD-binding subunit A
VASTPNRSKITETALIRAYVLERTTGIEPAFSAWEADVLPLNYIRVASSSNRLASRSA